MKKKSKAVQIIKGKIKLTQIDCTGSQMWTRPRTLASLSILILIMYLILELGFRVLAFLPRFRASQSSENMEICD